MSNWTRREFLSGAMAGAAALAWAPRLWATDADLSPKLVAELEKSPLVYLSPLKKDGSESRCHAEIWFAWDQASVVVVTSHDAWRARAIAKGLDRARIWVADYGRILIDASGKLAKAPRFDARGRIDRDPAAFARVLPIYARKYPDEWASKWEARFKQGMADGTRVLIRYTPMSA